MSNWISGNRLLTPEEMDNNAPIVWEYFKSLDWEDLSIAAMLGNMQVESTINPGVWSGRPNQTGSVGLTQWNPATKLTTWASTMGLDPLDGDTQLLRIQYEMENGLQWVIRETYDNITFPEFAVNAKGNTLEELVTIWVWCYEIPADPDIDLRLQYAEKWLNQLKMIPVWLLFKMAHERRKKR